eukprot:464732-Prymnesium_polylepis.1
MLFNYTIHQNLPGAPRFSRSPAFRRARSGRGPLLRCCMRLPPPSPLSPPLRHTTGLRGLFTR